jgi:hypothetical protein
MVGCDDHGRQTDLAVRPTRPGLRAAPLLVLCPGPAKLGTPGWAKAGEVVAAPGAPQPVGPGGAARRGARVYYLVGPRWGPPGVSWPRPTSATRSQT